VAYGVTSKMTVFFIVAAFRTSDLTYKHANNAEEIK
jgi:hypothetical protein